MTDLSKKKFIRVSPRLSVANQEIKKQLIENCPIVFKNYPISFAYLYGSYATNTAHKFSDLDIGVYVDEKLERERYLKMELSIALDFDDMLSPGVQSDVRVINHLPLLLKGEMITEGLLIYSRNEEKRVEYETIVRSRYFDFLPVIKAYQQEFRSRILTVE